MSDESVTLDDLGSAVSELRASWEEAQAQGETDTAETKQYLERVNDRIDEVEARFQKLDLDVKKTEGEPTDEHKAFEAYLRSRNDGEFEAKVAGMELEQKVLRFSDDTGGGFLAPDDFVNELITGVLEFSPMRQLATVRRTIRNSVKAPKRTGTASATWTSEQGTRSETTNPTFGQEEIPTHEAYALADVSFADLEDTALDLESFLQDQFVEQFGVLEGTAFISGNAVGKPEGILSNSDIGTVTSTSNDAINADDYAKLLYALKEPYHKNATWLLNRLTVRDTRLLKASGTGEYIWAPGFASGGGLGSGQPPTILDHPYLMATDMPVVADASKSVAVGDFKRAYWIVDRIDFAIQRDPYTQAASGNVRFHARKRLGGQVVVPEAIKILVTQ